MKEKIKELENKIGNTKTILASNIIKKFSLLSNLYLKLEKENFTGSSKDRLVYYIIKDGIEKGLINKNTIILEATSGNTGISISAISKYLGLKCIIVMPDNASIERIKIIKEYHGQVVLTPSTLGMQGSIKKLNELKKQYNNCFEINQFNNYLGINAHYETTGKEIYKDVPNIDVFICGIGTGTTFSGCSKYLKEQKELLSVAVLPISYPHKIQGIGAGFTPSIFNTSLVDEYVMVSDADAYDYTRLLYEEEQLLCGISSGAALYAGVVLARKHPGKNIVVILPDDGNRYISTGVFDGLKIN